MQNALDEDADHSVGGYAKSMAGGAAVNVATLGAGKAFAPVASKLAAPLKTAAGNATGKIASAARSAVSRFKGGCSSFSGATVVLMADGSEKAIEDIEIGDKVLATDPETGEQVAKEVTNVWVHDDTLVDLIIDGEAITTTEDHPFFNVTDGDFQWASQIDPGDQVLTDDGRLVTVQGIDNTTAHDALAYNLTVQGIHTYHVGQRHILVHNTDACSNNARILGRNLEKAGITRPAETAAHHIVASGHKAAAPARAQLQRHGIDINDASNGVFLPRFSSSINPAGASVHGNIHTPEYFTHVNNLMSGTRNADEALDVLSYIRTSPLGGFWP